MVVRERKENLGRFRLPKGLTITVGVHGEDGDKAHGDDGVTVADVAAWNEYGTSRIPQRSFIRGWFDENQQAIFDTLQGQMRKVAAGKLTADVAAERCALVFEGGIKKRIATSIPPPNAPVTIARKGSSTTLIDSGVLRNSIRAKVTIK